MDIEGLEGKAFESGIEFITNYHVPFIFMEFNPNYLSRYETNPQEFLDFLLASLEARGIFYPIGCKIHPRVFQYILLTHSLSHYMFPNFFCC